MSDAGGISVAVLAERLNATQWLVRRLLEELEADGFAVRVGEDRYVAGAGLTAALVSALVQGFDLDQPYRDQRHRVSRAES